MSVWDYMPSFIKDTFVQNPADAAYYDPQFNQYKGINSSGGVGTEKYGPFINAPVNAATQTATFGNTVVQPVMNSVASAAGNALGSNQVLKYGAIALGAIVVIKFLK